MKKILLLVLPLMAMCFASCEKNNGNELSGNDVINFEDAYFLQSLLCTREIEIWDAQRGILTYYLLDVDRNRDGQISVYEAQNVLGLDFYNPVTHRPFNVRSIPEIKYFTALEHLECVHNQLTSLDLSKNTALAYLSCPGNHLTSLDLSNNTALYKFRCDDNLLTSLDFSNNTALHEFNCDYNHQLTSLDLSNNTALHEFSCNNNQLTSLDLSNNTALHGFSCNNNQLTSLDLSKNMELEYFTCSGNPLTKIVLNKNNKIHAKYIQDIMSKYGDIIEYVD